MFQTAKRRRGAAAIIAVCAFGATGQASAQDPATTTTPVQATGDTPVATGDTPFVGGTTSTTPPIDGVVAGQTGDEAPAPTKAPSKAPADVAPAADEAPSGVLGARDEGAAPAPAAVAPATDAAAAPATVQGSQLGEPVALADTATPVALAATGEDQRAQIVLLLLGGAALLLAALALWPGRSLRLGRR